MEEGEETDVVIYEDEILEVISLSDEDEQQNVEDIGEEMDELQLQEDTEANGQQYSDEEDMIVNTFVPIRNDTIGCFTVHNGPVFAVSIDHTSSLICTGGQDDKGLVWRLSDMKTVFECTGHKDSVTCCSFSDDGQYLCTSDLSGLIQVWETSDGKLIWNFEASPVEWVLWHGHAHVLFCGTSGGEAWLWRIPSGECKTLPSSGYGNMSGVLLPDGKRLCCGYFDGSVRIWDIKNATQLCSLSNQNSPVTCLSCHSNGNMLLVGYMSGLSLLVSTSDLKALAKLTSPDLPKYAAATSNNSVESVSFAPPSLGHQLAFVATVTGTLMAWNIPTKKIRYSCQAKSGVVKMMLSDTHPVYYTCHIDGVVRKWDVMTGACLREWHGHSAGILDMTITRDELKIITTSDDSTVGIYGNTDHTP